VGKAMLAHHDRITALQATKEVIDLLQKRFKDKFFQDHSLAGYTTFKIGGPASYFVECRNRDDIIDSVNLAHQSGIRYFVIGGGSNILVSDSGYHGLIIYIANSELKIEADHLLVDAGYNLETLVNTMCNQGLQGIETLAGIKGTVGGAVYGNAGAFGTSIADSLISAEILKPGQEPRWEDNNYFAFSYRNSILKKTREVVLRVKLGFERKPARELIEKQSEILALRETKHPGWDCSAGCFFKNIEAPDQPHGKLAAGYLLDKIGAKNLTIGGARVFENHANILINSGQAKAEDVRKLAEMLKERVKNEFGYTLEEEITYLGD
jgi:UDP-N-acetylmuramate dehydrogenase